MPPNRKGNFDVVDSLASLSVDHTAVAKYAPLTSEPISVAPVHSKTNNISIVVTKASHVKDASHPANSYWDWPSDEDNSTKSNKQAVIERIVEEERIRQLLSVDRVESNLIQNTNNDCEATTEALKTIRANWKDDGYWDEEASETKEEEDGQMVTAKHASDTTHPLCSYWDWLTIASKDEQQKVFIEKILLEEKNRRLLCISHLEKQLVEDAKRNNVAESKVEPKNDAYWEWSNGDDNNSKESSSYWDWPTLTLEEQKKEIIRNIVEEEKIRQLMSVFNVQEQLVKHCRTTVSATRPPTTESATCFGDASYFADEPSYWDW